MKFDWSLYSKISRSPEGEGDAGGDPPAEGSQQADPPVDPVPAGEGDPPADPPIETPPEATVPMSVFQRRLSQVTAARNRAEAEAAELRAGLAKPPVVPDPAAAAAKPGLTEKDVEERAQTLVAAREFNARATAVVETGKKASADFMPTLENLKALAGGALPQSFVENILEIDAPHEVLLALGKDTTRAMEILDLPPNKQAIALAKYEVELKGKVKPAKPISKAPEPIQPQLGGSGGTAGKAVDLADPETDISAWMTARNKDVRSRTYRSK